VSLVFKQCYFGRFDVFVGSASCLLLNILRCFVSKNVAALVNAFKVYVRPILEYCSVVWCPHLVKDIDCIEKVQRRFTKRLPGMNNMTYYQRLHVLGLASLELRRIRIDLLFTYKIIFGLVDLNISDFFQ